MSRTPYGTTRFADQDVVLTPIPGGGYLLRNPNPPHPYPDHLIYWLRHWAKECPDRDFLCERGTDGEWRRLTYRDAAKYSACVAQSLLDRGYTPDRPIAIFSDNSIDFALLMMGAMHVSIPVMPVSPAYSLMSKDFAKLKEVVAHHDPSLIFVQNPAPFEAAIRALNRPDIATLVGVAGTPFDSIQDWYGAEPGESVEAALRKVGPDTNAKILLTSGSTGTPKGVINTQRMLCSNIVVLAQVWAFLDGKPLVMCDWLPWNHTFGGNFCFDLALYKGGTFYLDEGKPVPGRIEATIRNLRDVRPNVYFNVPRGFDMLLPSLESDREFAEAFFGDLDMLFFAGAALPENLKQRMDKVSVAVRGFRTPFTTSLGATETAPACTSMAWDTEVSGNVGVPLPGIDVKLVPNGSKLEVRFKGPNIMPGYYKRPELAADAFDDEGFFRIGDAAKLIDPNDPRKGLVFDGRVAENFKLLSGTWVHAGTLRLAAIAAAEPVIQDAVVTGDGREEVGLLAFPSLAGCRSLCGAPTEATLDQLVPRAEIHERIREAFVEHNRRNPGSSTRITRVLLMTEPPSIDAGEITDKGYINQRAVVERRRDLVQRLYSDAAAADVVVI